MLIEALLVAGCLGCFGCCCFLGLCIKKCSDNTDYTRRLDQEEPEISICTGQDAAGHDAGTITCDGVKKKKPACTMETCKMKQVEVEKKKEPCPCASGKKHEEEEKPCPHAPDPCKKHEEAEKTPCAPEPCKKKEPCSDKTCKNKKQVVPNKLPDPCTDRTCKKKRKKC